ncbi:PREDICTED: LOW QUALITY PROTEIN: uncharacterized protein LOC103598355, partial [Galeopterus variegatus]|uniref:LOW QUALITY PROTEIN: uncharacterized protein LOC103598355 n=1 Tax=Galeopterus variegatus TaxID=482537 RepID=A0ABM0RIY1_GALVR
MKQELIHSFKCLLFLPCSCFLWRKMPCVLKVAGAGCSVGLEKGQCSCNLFTPCALTCCDVLTGVLTLGLDMSHQGCQSAATGLEDPAGLGLGSTCLVKHLSLLWLILQQGEGDLRGQVCGIYSVPGSDVQLSAALVHPLFASPSPDTSSQLSLGNFFQFVQFWCSYLLPSTMSGNEIIVTRGSWNFVPHKGRIRSRFQTHSAVLWVEKRHRHSLPLLQELWMASVYHCVLVLLAWVSRMPSLALSFQHRHSLTLLQELWMASVCHCVLVLLAW